MVKLENGMYIDGYLNENIALLKDFVKDNWDGIGFISGYEGSGKTTLANQIAYACDPTFDVSRIVFNANQFKIAVANAKEYQAIVFDEAYMSFSTKRHNSKEQAELTDILTRIREKNLFIFFVAPSFFDITKYLAVWRSRFLIHVYSQGRERGFFQFYSRDKKKELYIKGKQFENMNAVKADFIGRFTKFEPVDILKYKDKKMQSINEILQDRDKKDQKIDKRNEMILHAYKKLGSYERVGEIVGLSKSQVQRIIKEFENSGGFESAPA